MSLKYPTTSKTLLDKIASGDEISWDEFYQKYSPIVKAIACFKGLNEVDADDICQQVMMQFFKQSETLRELLQVQPQLANKCDKWDDFDGYDWSRLLREQPQFADKCDKWGEFDAEDWSFLLREQPQFADKCNKWRKFNGGDWSCLLYKQPQFADKCDWEKLARRALIWLLQKHPEFADKLLHVSVSDGSNAK